MGGHQTDLNGPVDGGSGSGSGGGSSGDFLQLHNLQTLQPLCQYGVSPSIVVALVMRLLATHFSDPRLIMTEGLKKYVWTSDPATNKLRIIQNTQFNPADSGLMPALVVTRRPIKSSRKVNGDRSESTPGDAAEGIESYVRFHEGSVRIFCLAEAAGEAEDLALEVFDTLTFLSPMMVQRLPFHNFEVTGLGERGVLDGLANKVGIPVDIEFAYEYAWAIKPLAPRLKTLNLQSIT